MRFVFDPEIPLKIDRMKQRVCWNHREVLSRDIDQTALSLDNAVDSSTPFSFCVLGDSGVGDHRGDNPQRRVAEWLMANSDDCQFILHTGDLVYLVGAKEKYLENFIRPYREWLVGGDAPETIKYDQMTFKTPFLPVLGNHDYYDVPMLYGLLARILAPIRYLIRKQVDIDYGFHGSRQGDVYARAFLDYLRNYNFGQLPQHLEEHYTASSEKGRCLRYRPGLFTRIPNRYYTFRQGGVDFFALDSNTFNTPLPLLNTSKDDSLRQEIIAKRKQLIAQKSQILDYLSIIQDDNFRDEDDDLKDDYVKIEQINEQLRDADKQLANCHGEIPVDQEQLNWLKERLIDSCQNPDVRGRIIYFHHPPYVTEATKWYQGQTLAVRSQIRRVLDDVQIALGKQRSDRPIVDLIINGHAHCFEHIETLDTGHADSYTHCLICGGSGFSLRRQRSEGNILTEGGDEGKRRDVAKSHMFLGRTGHGSEKHRPYSALKIDVLPGTPPRYIVRPYVTEYYQHQWKTRTIMPIEITPRIH